MKYFLFLLLLNIATVPALAIYVEVIGKKGEVLFAGHGQYALPSTVGKISISAFDSAQVPYDGSIYGVSKIYGLGQDLEIISDSEMKAYGWCFSIDGLVPETLTDETPVIGADAVILWFYAYAHYKEGQWVGQCVKDE